MLFWSAIAIIRPIAKGGTTSLQGICYTFFVMFACLLVYSITILLAISIAFPSSPTPPVLASKVLIRIPQTV